MHVVGVRVFLGTDTVIGVHMLHFVDQSVMHATDRNKVTLPGAGAPFGSYQRTNSHSHSHGHS